MLSNLASHRYKVMIVASSEDLDLAILEIDPMPLNFLEMGDSDSVVCFDRVTLLGFPNFNLGDSGVVKRGEVGGFRMKTTYRRIFINSSIVAGNSGGPLLDSKNRVIGVAATGAEDARKEDRTENHAAIPIAALSNLAKT
jgi:S1-C subfamily serine protease